MHLKFLRAAMFLVAAFYLRQAIAQKPVGTWENMNVILTVSPKWEARAELQLRSQEAFKNNNYIEYVFSAGYRLNDHFSFFIGSGGYETFALNGNFKTPFQQRETRLFEQAFYRTNIWRVRIDNRLRVEQRWLSSGYRNRLRFRINPILPLNHKTIDKGAFYATASNEVLFQSIGAFVDRNWLFAGAGYVFNNTVTLQAGVLHQDTFNTRLVSTTKNFLQTTLQLRFNAHFPHKTPGNF